jgi:hypothetical protein
VSSLNPQQPTFKYKFGETLAHSELQEFYINRKLGIFVFWEWRIVIKEIYRWDKLRTNCDRGVYVFWLN